MVSRSRCCIAGGIFLGLLGVALVVMAALIQDIVNDAIDDGVQEGLTINFDAWDDEQRTDWLNTDREFHWYFWNYTNVDAVLAGTDEKFVIEEIGPYTIREESFKYNVSFPEVDNGEIVEYNTWSRYTATTDPLYAVIEGNRVDTIAEDMITNLNSLYLGLIAQMKVLPFIVAGAPALPQDELSAQGVAAFAAVDSLKTAYTATGGDFLAFTRAGGFSQFIDGVAQTVMDNGYPILPTTEQMLQHLMTCTGLAGLSCGAAGLEMALAPGIMANATMAQYDAAVAVATAAFQVPLLAPFSTMEGSAFLFLVGALADASTAAATPVLDAYYGGTEVAAYYKYLTTHPAYEAGTVEGVNQILVARGVDTVYGNTTSFADIGALQFGTGVMANPLFSDPATNPTVQGGASLDQNVADHPFGNTEYFGPEWAVFKQAHTGLPPVAASYTDRLAMAAGAMSTDYPTDQLTFFQDYMTITQANAFLDTFSNATYAGLLLGLDAMDPTDVNTFVTTFGAAGAVAQIVPDASVIGNATLIGQFYGAMLGKMQLYVGHYIAYHTFLVGEVFTQNGGIFTTHSAEKQIFGHTDDPLIALFASIIPGLSVPGRHESYSSAEEHFAATNQGIYELYTGAGTNPSDGPRPGEPNLNIVRHYRKWKGISGFTTVLDLATTETGFLTSNCLDFVTNMSATCPFWQSREVIDGCSDAAYSQPFLEGEDPVEVLSAWTFDVARCVNFTYSNDVEYEGISMRRYIVDADQTKNSTEVPYNIKFNQVGPEGLLYLSPILGETQAFLTRPHMFDVDPCMDRVTGQMPDPELHETEIWVEPLTGATMFGRKRFQGNFLLEQSRYNAGTTASAGWWSNIWNAGAKTLGTDDCEGTTFENALLAPAFWAIEGGQIEPEDASDFRSAVYDNRDLAEWLEIAFYAVGAALIAGSVACVYYFCRQGSGYSEKNSRWGSTNDMS